MFLSNITCQVLSCLSIPRCSHLINFFYLTVDEPAIKPLPRFCVLQKLSSGYGFYLNTEGGDRPGQYMRKVVNGGAASIAGVREGRFDTQRN